MRRAVGRRSAPGSTATTRQAMPLGKADDLRLVHDDRLAGFDSQDLSAGFDQCAQRAQTDRRDIEAHVLLRFGDLDHREAALRTQLAGSANAGVGSLHRLDGDGRQPFDDDRLAHVHASQFLGQLPTELNVFPLSGGRLASASGPSFTSNSGAKSVGGAKMMPSSAYASINVVMSVSSGDPVYA